MGWGVSRNQEMYSCGYDCGSRGCTVFFLTIFTRLGISLVRMWAWALVQSDIFSKVSLVSNHLTSWNNQIIGDQSVPQIQ